MTEEVNVNGVWKSISSQHVNVGNGVWKQVSQKYVNINGVWNLVLADPHINGEKGARIPDIKYLNRLYNRNEFYIESKHPLAETIVNQTGYTPEKRRQFLDKHYELALNQSIHKWAPKIELIGNF